MKRIIFFLLFIQLQVYGQSIELYPVNGLSTEIVYNLFSDSKGFLWVGHSLGISRYNGKKFTNFISPKQSSLGLTNICEDKQGRIWCNNFNGQVFYIENENIYLYEPYKADQEISFPFIIVYKNELIITSQNGLFICNTKDLSGRYIKINKENDNIRSLCINQNKVIFNTTNDIYTYSEKKIKKLILKNNSTDEFSFDDELFFAQISTYDTIYAKNRVRKSVVLFTLIKDTIFFQGSKKMNSLINTITQSKKTIWYNLTEESISSRGDKFISNYNLSDIESDQFGITWYSSLQNGLLINQKTNSWESNKLKILDKSDFIRCIIEKGGKIIYGSQKGVIYVYDKIQNKLVYSAQLPLEAGSIENIHFLPNDRLLIAPAIGLYISNIEAKIIYPISKIATLKTYSIQDSILLLGYADRLEIVLLNKVMKKYLFNTNKLINNESTYISNLSQLINDGYKILRKTRTYQITTDSSLKTTYINFKDGVFEYRKPYFIELKFENQPIRSNSLLQNNSTLYIGTINEGLLIKKGIQFNKINSNNGLVSNTVLLLRSSGNNIYILLPGFIQIWNEDSQKITNTISVPEEINGSVYDILAMNNTVYITSSKSVYEYRIPSEKKQNKLLYLLAVKNTQTDEIIKNSSSLSYDNNSIRFVLNSPDYNNVNEDQLMYRLRGAYDSSWKRISRVEKIITFTALRPGSFIFESYITDYTGVPISNTIQYKFEINKPWWLTNLAMLLFIFFLGIIIIVIANWRINLLKKNAAQKINNLQLENKLVNSTLTAIKAQMNPHFIFNALNTIQSFVYSDDKRNASNYLGKFSGLMRDVLENSQKETITLAEEVEMLRLYTDIEKNRFSNEIDIIFNIDPTIEMNEINLPPMLVQPYLENTFKHAFFHKLGAKKLIISITKFTDSFEEEKIKICIEDNGIGRVKSAAINIGRPSYNSFALKTSDTRIELLNKKYPEKINLLIEDKYTAENESAGMIVNITIPFNL